MTDPLIEVRNVTKTFVRGDVSITPLADVTLTIARGEFVALIGPSGSGKSTLLNLMAGFDRVTEGSVRFEKHDIGEWDEATLANWRNRHVGFIFQAYNLLPVLSAYENVELPLLLTHLSRSERAQHVQTALSFVGLSDRVNHYPRQLSGGQEQRVAIARAIVGDPTVVLADEPTGNLDGQSATEVFELLRLLNERLGTTIVMVTHDQRALSYAKTIRELDKGRLSDRVQV
jgi:putative ABC transport system ATP-binding protein